MNPYTPQDPQAHERQCLEQAKLAVSDFRKPELIHDVRLEGSYPDTRLIVEVSNLRDPTHVELEWQLWGGLDFGDVGALGTESPEMVGDYVLIAVNEHCLT